MTDNEKYGLLTKFLETHRGNIDEIYNLKKQGIKLGGLEIAFKQKFINLINNLK